ncbi:hypothetical protein VPH35_088191 [Triticum aestivum]
MDRIRKRDYGPLDSQLEPMKFSDPTNCFPDQLRCCIHFVCNMMQFFSLKLAKVSANTSLVQLYGYIAVRDSRDLLLNYIVSRSRDDPIVVKQGSLIEMTGPKRGINMLGDVLVEFDMRIKTGGQKEDNDLQLIDGVVEYSKANAPFRQFTERINGNCGAVDITLARVPDAVEATIDVIISKMQRGFNLSLSSFVFIGGSHKEIELLCDIIGESCGLTRRHAIAVQEETWMYLKLKVGPKGSNYNDVERYCQFKANIHGCDYQEIMLKHASILVKVSWSIIP